MMGKNQGKQKKKGNTLNTLILILALAVMALALYKLIPTLLEYKKGNDMYDQMSQDYVSTGTIEGELPEEEWATVEIDFDSLLDVNPDVIGWIRFDNLDAVAVDYPILHGDSNSEYLRSDINHDYLISGCIFLETSNSTDWSDYYNIIYGHNMKNTSMFGTLKKYKTEENFYEDNQYFTIYTLTGAYRYRIFSYEDVADDSDIYTVGYQPDEVYQAFLDQMVANSMIDTGIVPTNTDKVVTLSTCSTAGSTIRFVLHAMLVDQRIYE